MKKQISYYMVAILLGCNQSKQVAPTASQAAVQYDSLPEKTALAPDRFQKQFESGFDFLASGNEPFWALEINFDSSMNFRTPHGKDFSTTVLEGVKAMDANVIRYAGNSEQGSIITQIQKLECVNDMSGEKVDYTVTVDVKQGNEPLKTYKGCGRYLNDYRINDIWVLHAINGKSFDATGFAQGAPRLEFGLAANRVMGNAGCNEFSGPVEIQGKKIKFGMFRSTKMACEKLEFESNFLRLVTNKIIAYSITSGKLNLQVNKDSVFMYKKVD